MVVGGFLEPTLNRIPGDLRELLRSRVEAALEGKLPDSRPKRLFEKGKDGWADI